MPPKLPLDITALVSWCSTDDWIGDLPINAAIPMYFRMEPDRQRLLVTSAPDYRLSEPLCTQNVGVSITEPWPEGRAEKRIFIFADRGWARDFAMLRSVLSFDNSQMPPGHP
jgi:hypothetical protein